jgi:NAD(P)-dependent dehydrogenase (short-subunit alcohol dehydrogenase family)
MSVVAVTGASSGIGAATRTRLEQDGHRVVGVDVAGGEVVADLGNVAGRQAAINGVLARCDGRLDGLVTAAGVPARAPMADIVSINYFGTVDVVRGLQPALVAPGQSRVVAVSSVFASTLPGVPEQLVDLLLAGEETAARALVAGYPPNRHIAVYAATKIAIARWVRRQAPQPEWARSGVRLNAIAPGLTRTGFFADVADDDERQTRLPVGHAAAPEQIAAWIVMMLGDAAEFLCGSVVYVDGGTDARHNADSWPKAPSVAGADVAPNRRGRLVRRRR